MNTRLKTTRSFSNAVTFTAINRAASPMTTLAGKIQPMRLGRLKVPLLKSPSHLGHYTSRVNRMYNEDRYSACVLDLPNNTVFNFNVFDGHGGEQCLSFLEQNLGQVVEQCTALVDDANERELLIQKYRRDIGGYWRRWYKHREQNYEKMALAVPQVSTLEKLPNLHDDLMLRLPLAFLEADYRFFNEEDNALGSTCTLLYLETIHAELPGEFKPVFEDYFFNRKTVSRLTVAHVGDTKAILVDRFGEAHALTEPHHPLNPIEASRLRKYSANYFMTDSFGEERFISLANTRAFGDLKFKEMGVTAEPDVSQYIIGDIETILKMLTPDEIKTSTIGGLGGDESFLVLCTDGVSNELTDQEIADIIMVNFNLRGHRTATPQFCAEEVVKFVEYIGGDDNATCLVVRLNGWGKWPVVDRTGDLRQERLNEFTPRDRG